MLLVVIFSILVLGYGLFLLGLSFWVSHALTVPPRQKQKKTPADDGLAFSPMTLTTADGHRLRGWVVAACGPSRGTLILCHNYKASKQKMLPWIRFLSRAGYETVAFDFNGHGESDQVHSFGKLLSRTLIDLETILNQLDRLSLANRSRVGLMGFSMGSVPILGYLASHPGPTGIHAVVFDSGPPNPLVWNSRVNLALKPVFTRLPGICLVHRVVRRLHRFSLFCEGVRSVTGQLQEIDIPFFLIQGLKDNISTPDQSRWLYDHLVRAPKFYWTIDEAHHMTNLCLRKDEYQQRVLAFFEQYLTGEAPRTDQLHGNCSF